MSSSDTEDGMADNVSKSEDDNTDGLSLHSAEHFQGAGNSSESDYSSLSPIHGDIDVCNDILDNDVELAIINPLLGLGPGQELSDEESREMAEVCPSEPEPLDSFLNSQCSTAGSWNEPASTSSSFEISINFSSSPNQSSTLICDNSEVMEESESNDSDTGRHGLENNVSEMTESMDNHHQLNLDEATVVVTSSKVDLGASFHELSQSKALVSVNEVNSDLFKEDTSGDSESSYSINSESENGASVSDVYSESPNDEFCDFDDCDSNIERNECDALSDSSDGASDDDMEAGVLFEGECRTVLHDHTDLTVEDGVLRVLNVYMNNKCSKKCLRDVLFTVCLLLPRNHAMPTSIHKLFQYVNKLAPQINELNHYYCSACLVYFGNKPVAECPTCQCLDKCGLFYEFDISDVVKYFFEHRNLAKIMEDNPPKPHTAGVISDIQDGAVYRDLNSNRSKYDLTLILSSDGVSLRKSSTSELWLLMLMPVEVPQHLRKSFISIIGVWFDISQPNMNTFLKPFCVKLKHIFENTGVQWKHPVCGEIFNSQVIAPLFIADAPARAKVQNVTNFNGKYGCNICEVKSVKTAPIPGKKRYRVYSNSLNAPLREGRRMVAQGVLASQLGTRVKGVKGPSVMSIIPYINMASLLLPEYLHSVLLGVVRQLMYLWFHKTGDWSCKEYLSDINKFLNEIRVPDFIQRKPRGICSLKYWKASEFYHWLLFYSLPALKTFLPERYYQHYLLLVHSVFSLLQSEISEKEIQESEVMLQLFVHDMEQLYGDRAMTYNVHQLSHLGLSVRRWGPLCLTSAFEFEDMNGTVSKTTHGTKHISKEIVNNIKVSQGINILKNKVRNRAPVGQRTSTIPFKLLGKKVVLNLNEEDTAVLLSKGVSRTMFGYTKVSIGGCVFTSSMYKQLRTANYYVSWKGINGSEYGCIRFFIEDHECLFMFIDVLDIQHEDVLYHVEIRKAVSHILPFKRSSQSLVLKVEDDIQIMKEIAVGNYICKRPNLFFQVM